MKLKVKRLASALMLAGMLSGVSDSLLAISSAPSAPIQGHAPVASELEFASAPVGAESVALEWRFSDDDGDAEQGSSYVWSIVDDDDKSTPISGAESATLATIPEAAINKRVQACVTPRTNEATTLPSQGVPTCLAAVVAAPAPSARDLSIAVKEVDGLYTVNNTLTGTYVYNGIGDDKSVAIFAPHGQAEKKLLAGEGVATDKGVVADFKMTGLAGRKVELGVMPLSHYGGKGKIVVLESDEYIYDPTLPPRLSTYTNTIYDLVSPTIKAVPYVLDRAGGAAGDRSTYKFLVGSTVVNSGNTVNGTIPAQRKPDGVFGDITYELTPVNGAGISGSTEKLTGFGGLVNYAAVPSIDNLVVTWSGAPAAPAVGSTLNANYDFNADNGTASDASLYAWRVFKNDSDKEKRTFLSSYGHVVHQYLIPRIPSLVIPPHWAGKQLELIVLARNGVMASAATVKSVRIGTVSGTAPTVTNPAALPSIPTATEKFTTVGLMRTWYLYGVNFETQANGGYPLKEIRYSWVAKKRGSGTVTRDGPYKTQTPHASRPAGDFYDSYVSLELQPVSTDGVKEIVGNKITINMSDLGMGPGGTGLEFDSVGTTPDATKIPLKFALDDNGVAGSGLRPGKLLSATYDFTPYPGTKDVTTYSWNGSATKTVVTPKQVPAYRIQESDIGRTVELTIIYGQSDGNKYGNASNPLNKTTDGFLGGIVLESESPSVPESFELMHNKLGYVYLPAVKESENIYHTWAEASSGCGAKGSGWRLPTAAELVSISADKVTRPGSWPKEHLYWTSEEVAKPDYRTVYLETGNIVTYGGGSPNLGGMTTPAVCVKAQS